MHGYLDSNYKSVSVFTYLVTLTKLLTVVYITFITQNFSLLVIIPLFWCLGLLIHKNSTELKLYLTLMSIFATYSLIISYIVVGDSPEVRYYVAVDSLFFWNDILNLSYNSTLLGGLNNIVFSGQYPDLVGFRILYFTVAKLSASFGELEHYSQIFVLSQLSALVPFYLFKLLKEFDFNELQSYRLALIYSLFCFVFFYSGVFVRDSIVSAIFSIIFYYILKRDFAFKDLAIITILSLICLTFRFQHGLIACCLGLISSYRVINRRLFYFIAFATLPAIIFFFVSSSIYDDQLALTSRYLEKSIDSSSGGSLGAIILKLPIPLNYLGMGAFSQLLPFPFWVYLEDSYLRVFESLSGIYWFLLTATSLFCFLMIVFSQRTQRFWSIFKSKNLKMYSTPECVKNIFLLCISISAVAIILASSEANVRRIYCFYPVLFVFYNVIKSQCSVSQYTYTWYFVVINYVLLNIIYFSFK
ncbi:hypothetical protein [Vibrio breoganii]|uniref:hypothetical protein n=1 Tax=Vibrio breoganii TaxID=553239 RepID=UPI0002F7ABE2|nr:hypothetical protein [Vibrio breoganii]OED98589.1 hypothetical protein A1QE_00975 [Vibrio breoganii ZF-55]